MTVGAGKTRLTRIVGHTAKGDASSVYMGGSFINNGLWWLRSSHQATNVRWCFDTSLGFRTHLAGRVAR